MNDLLIGFLGAMLATNQPAALSNLVQQKTGIRLPVADTPKGGQQTNDPVEQEFSKLMADDDAAQAEVDQWIKNDQQLAVKGDTTGSLTLQGRIKQRLDLVKKAYEDFFRRHPEHGRARIAYASFLCDTGEEREALPHLQKARELDPKNPAVWNQLANWHGHNSPVTNSFDYYQKAVDLDPTEPTYYWNFATTVFLFRRDATNHFNITEQQVFEKALALYRKAVELDPENFELVTDYAQTYYGVKVPKTGDPKLDHHAVQKHCDEALGAWQVALKMARDDIEKQGIYVHFARLQINADRFDDARTNLAALTHPMFAATKGLLEKKLKTKESEASKTSKP